MSFQLLKAEIIDKQLCQGCGLCAGSCKHIEMVGLKPHLKDNCILETNGLACGKCYDICPQVHQSVITKQEPMESLAVKSNNPKVIEKATNGGAVTEIGKYLLESDIASHVIQTKVVDGVPKGVIATDPEDFLKYSGTAYGRSGSLQKLIETLATTNKNKKNAIAFVGVPCEITGAERIEKIMDTEIIKIGLFCAENYPNSDLELGQIQSPCTNACPAGVNASGYIRLIRDGKYAEAVDLIRQNNPFPSVCGRVCTHECEANCSMIGTSDPIAIRELKKYVTQWEIDTGREFKENKPNGKKVAIIGGGPGGLSAAYYLAKKGYQPTVFEKGDKFGGMLRYGIPQFRLADDVLDHDIEVIKKAGVELKPNTTIGQDLTFNQLKEQGYEAIFLAIGQYKPYSMKLPGEDLNNVHKALDFVQKWKYDIKDDNEIKGKKVIVVGGGSVALDAAQTALRLGASNVKVVYRRSEEELPARRDDYKNALAEGVEFLFLRNPTGIVPDDNGNVKGIELIEMELCEVDASGRRKPRAKEGCEEIFVEADHVIIAIGQGVALDEIQKAAEDKLEIERNKIKVDQLTLQTSIPYVFAGGDAITHSKNVAITAIAHGHEAAISIDRFLKGKDLKEGRIVRSQMYTDYKFHPTTAFSPEAPKNPIDSLFLSTKEIEAVFSEAFAQKEAERCVGCNNYCRHCQDYLGEKADISVGNTGAPDGYSTVLVWTERGKKIIDALLKDKKIQKDKVNIEAIHEERDKKAKRNIIEHPLSLRDLILTKTLEKGEATISEISKEIGIDTIAVRYHMLRLAQDNKLSMVLGDIEPIFSEYKEE